MAKFLISAFADEASEELDLQIAALKRNGVRCIEPRSVNGNMVKKTDEELEEIAKKLRDNGISLSSLGSPIGKFSIDEDFEKPPFLGEEVTGDAKYYNSSLSRYPYK